MFLGQVGRPKGKRLSPELAEELREELKRRCGRKGIAIEELGTDFPGLPARSRTWIYRAMQAGKELPVTDAIELAIRARHRGMRLGDVMLAKLERTVIPPEPAVVVLPGEAAALAAYVCDLVDGKPRKRAEASLRKAFERFENANKLAPIREMVAQLVDRLGGSHGALSLRHANSAMTAIERTRANLALLRDGAALDNESFRVPSSLAKLARFLETQQSTSKVVRK